MQPRDVRRKFRNQTVYKRRIGYYRSPQASGLTSNWHPGNRAAVFICPETESMFIPRCPFPRSQNVRRPVPSRRVNGLRNRLRDDRKETVRFARRDMDFYDNNQQSQIRGQNVLLKWHVIHPTSFSHFRIPLTGTG